jgi:hypothetical protein
MEDERKDAAGAGQLETAVYKKFVPPPARAVSSSV